MSRVQLLPWCDESKDMNDIYVTLKLKKGSRKGTTLLTKNEDLASLQKSDGMPATRILVKGVAGSGKSTLLAKLAYTWSQQMNGSPLAKYQLLFILSLREVKSVSLIDEIFEQIFETNTTVSREGLEAYIESNPQLVLLLLDGFDEYSASNLSTLDGSLQEILAFKRLRECHTILSTRPHKDLQTHQSSYLLVDVLGFSRKNVELYMNRFFNNKEMVQGLKERITQSERLTSLSKIPVMLMLMCLLWEDEQKLRDTQSELYQDFVLFLWRKFCMRQGKDIDKIPQIEGEFPVFIYRLGCLALEGLCSKNNITEERLVFSENDFEDSSYQLGCKTGLLTREMIRSRLSVDNAVTFLHKSFQEFCAAKYWASLYTTDRDKFNSILIQLQPWNIFMSKFDLVKFCCGLAEKDGMVSIIQYVIKLYKANQTGKLPICIGYDKPESGKKSIVNILTLLYESHNTSACSFDPSQKETVKSHQSTKSDVLNTSLTMSFKSIFPDDGFILDVGDKYPKAKSMFLNFVKSGLGSSILGTVKSITIVNPYQSQSVYADTLICMSNVEKLEFSFKEFDKQSKQYFDHLEKAVGALQKLGKLKLSYSNEVQIEWLSVGLLQEINLAGNTAGTATALLFQQMCKCSELSKSTEQSKDHNQMTPGDDIQINVIKQLSLEYIADGDESSTDSHSQEHTNLLRKFGMKVRGCNNTSDELGYALFTHIINQHVQVINISNVTMEENMIKTLSEYLFKSFKLTDLNLSHIEIKEDHSRMLTSGDTKQRISIEILSLKDLANKEHNSTNYHEQTTVLKNFHFKLINPRISDVMLFSLFINHHIQVIVIQFTSDHMSVDSKLIILSKIIPIIPVATNLHKLEVKDSWHGKGIAIGPIVEQLQHCPKFNSLKLSNAGLKKDHIKTLSKFLSKIPNLQELDLSFNTVGKAIAHLVEQLQHCTKLISLDLRVARLKEDHIKTLSELLPKVPSLQKLILSTNTVGMAIVPLVKQLQYCTNLITLSLRKTELKEDHIKILSKFLPNASKLQGLYLNTNAVGMALVPLAQQLQHCPMLSELGLGHTHITDQGVIELSHRFGSMPNLTRLQLDCNDIGNTGVDALFRHIHHLTKLEYMAIDAKINNQCSALVRDCLVAIRDCGKSGYDPCKPHSETQRISQKMDRTDCQLVQRIASQYPE
ncbi:NLR family CARD domain-containing protein 4-like [Amphiura filiformis]|uniref:NLR family CARD domain-containing protein 4-like n=1 Tax=Amphiura filiformis TaxID=82378 RepID=UPI003B216D2C